MSEKKQERKVIKPYTGEQLQAHALKCGGNRNLKELVLTPEDDDTEYVFLVKKPTRSMIQAITSANNRKDIDASAKILMGCVLEGDLELLEQDGAMYLAMVENLTGLMVGVKSELKKV